NDITKGVYLKGDKKLFEKLPPHKTLFKISKNKALPIGNLTSQFFANVYMNDFDNYIKRKLKVKRYIRYVDDFILFGNSKEELMEKYYKIVDYLKTELDLNLRDRYIIRKNSDGLDFLGYIVRPNYTLTRKRVVNNFKYKKAKFLTKYEELDGKIDLKEIKEFQSINASFLGHIKHSNSYNLAKKVGLKK
ncbi:MAG: RNA-directed DNA polymerase, partial [Campylobacterota bacterium]|nr:RNA-directed DNA polymerase [Campylobacterota bacterium]